jgi:hypothetical protein
MDGQWQPGFHDPTLIGWATTAAYLLAAILSLHIRTRPDSAQHKLTWSGLTFLLLFFTLNKQLDLQTWMRFAGRDFTQEHALYQNKNLIRLSFMLLLLFGAGSFTLLFRKRILSFLKRLPMIAVGLVLYILIRGLDFPHLELLPDQWQWTIEVGGLALILFALFRHLGGESREPKRA